MRGAFTQESFQAVSEDDSIKKNSDDDVRSSQHPPAAAMVQGIIASATNNFMTHIATGYEGETTVTNVSSSDAALQTASSVESPHTANKEFALAKEDIAVSEESDCAGAASSAVLDESEVTSCIALDGPIPLEEAFPANDDKREVRELLRGWPSLSPEILQVSRVLFHSFP